MTVLIATVTPTAGFLTQDTLVCRDIDSPISSTGSITSDIQEAMRETLIGTGRPPQIEPVGHISKLSVYPHLQLVTGATGCSAMMLAWKMCLSAGLKATSIDELDKLTPETLRSVRNQVPGGVPFISLHIGYSKAERRVKGFAYSSANNFASVALTEGHFISPPPDTTDPYYPTVAEKWAPAANGIEIAKFHRLTAANQYRAFKGGRFRNGAGLGGDLITACVRQGEVTIETSPTTWRGGSTNAD